jgi:hypothetical protein
MKAKAYIFLIATLLLFVSKASAQNSNKAKSIKIKGTVVAVDTMYPLMMCYHVCMISLLVKLGGKETGKYAIVNVRHMDDRHFEERGLHVALIEKSDNWEFIGTPNTPDRLTLTEFRPVSSRSSANIAEPGITYWTLLEGAEGLQLPFGNFVSSYNVEIGKFKRGRSKPVKLFKEV